MSDVKERMGTIKVCPACGQSLESFQTRCPSCGHEINTAAAAESVQGFFQKLEELSEREYEADKSREGQKKQKKTSPWPLRLCEIFAVVSLVLIILHVTGINKTLTGRTFNPAEIPSITIVNNTGYEIREVYISPSALDHWGNNFLVSGRILDNNETQTFTLSYPLGTHRRYDIQLRDPDGDTYTISDVDVTRQNRIVFTFSDID